MAAPQRVRGVSIPLLLLCLGLGALLYKLAEEPLRIPPPPSRRMRGQGVFAELIANRFASALRRAGLENAAMPELRTDLFEPPGFQASLF